MCGWLRSPFRGVSRLRVLVLVPLLACASPLPLAAATAGTLLGPPGGRVSSLAYCPIDPVTLHAAVIGGGVWRGAGMGESWSPERRELPPDIASLADLCWGRLVAGTSEGIFYFEGGLWRSGGELDAVARDLLAVPPESHGEVWHVWAATRSGLYVSRDGGESWSRATVDGIGARSSFLELARVELPEPALLVTSDVPAGGLFRSTDGGASWSRVPGPAGLGDAGRRVTVLAPASGSPVVYAASPYEGTYPTVFRSDDGGRSWRRVSDGLPESRSDTGGSVTLAVSSLDPDRVLAGGAAGLYRSTDGGESWRAVATPAAPRVLEPLPDGGFLLGTDGDGVYRSDDGLAWRPRSRGLEARPVAQVLPDPRSNGTIWLLDGDRHGRSELMVTHDWGRGWERLPSHPEPIVDALDATLHPAAPRSLWTRARTAAGDGELFRYRSDVAGGQLLRAPAAVDWASTTALAPDPSSPPRVYVLENDLETTTARLFRSTDGLLWQPVGQPLDGYVNGLAVDPRRPSRLWAWSVFEEGHRETTIRAILWRSDDEGSSWHEVADVDGGLLHPPHGIATDDGLFAFGLVFDPAFDPLEYHRLLRSLDGGASWELVGPLGSSLPDRLAVDPGDGSRLYRLLEDLPVQIERSTDGGTTWEPFWRIPEVTRARAIALSADGSILYAATWAGLWARATAADAGEPPTGGDPFPPPPPGPAHTTPGAPGFRFWSRIVGQEGQVIETTEVRPCLPETLCLAGSLPDRVEVLVRIVGPKGNGYLWPTVVRFTTSTVDLWIEQVATGEVRYYRLEGVSPGVDELTGFFDRTGFRP